VDTETAGAENTLPEQEATRKSNRPPPIVMTFTTNLIQLQSDLKEHAKGEYEFRNTRSGTRIITKEMADYLAMKSYLEKHNLQYFTFSPNSEKPIKAVIRHLPPDSLEDMDFNVIYMRQLTTNRTAPNGQTHVETLSLFLVTLIRKLKSQEIFKLNSLNHIIIKVKPYRAQTGLTQCYNCQNFGHVCSNCKQPPKCLWCGGGHLHRECPEKTNTESTPRCCNCIAVEGEKPHPASY
jgi:DNA replicative helicase MCM subunit Mcm2 (Cdc46/Mcm family)